jgi:4-hydroxy-4-methyl-2-oxoglutarate aldolase
VTDQDNGTIAGEFLRYGAATVYEAARPISPDACHIIDGVHPAWPAARAAGPALPVGCIPRDNLSVHRAVAEAQPGTVLIIAASGDPSAYWGSILTIAAKARGIAGVVVDGGIRDVAELRELRFPVWSTCITIRSATKAHPGTIGCSVECGNAQVRKDDYVIADDDGAVVVPAQHVNAVRPAAHARHEREGRLASRLQSGENPLNLLQPRSAVSD